MTQYVTKLLELREEILENIATIGLRNRSLAKALIMEACPTGILDSTGTTLNDNDFERLQAKRGKRKDYPIRVLTKLLNISNRQAQTYSLFHDTLRKIRKHEELLMALAASHYNEEKRTQYVQLKEATA